jgi:hypothetical protein
MIARLFMGSVLALSMLASPTVAQPVPNPEDSPMQHRDAMTHDEMSRHYHMGMHDRMARDRMMRWCRSLSYRRMMRNPRCRMLMHMHMHHMDRMHHM